MAGTSSTRFAPRSRSSARSVTSSRDPSPRSWSDPKEKETFSDLVIETVSRYAPNATLTLFDFPEPNVTSDQRNVTTVPQQQLFVLNSPFMMEMSREFAKRLEKAAPQDSERLQRGWQLAYGRIPSAEEISLALDFLHSPEESEAAGQLSRWEQIAHALLAGNELMFLP